MFPLANRSPIEKLISENGVPLAGERATREDKRVQEELLKAERDKEKDERDAPTARRTTKEESSGW